MTFTFHRMSTRTGTTALALVMTIGIIGISAPSADARAIPWGGREPRSCYQPLMGKVFPHDGVVVFPDGGAYLCSDGYWIAVGHRMPVEDSAAGTWISAKPTGSSGPMLSARPTYRLPSPMSPARQAWPSTPARAVASETTGETVATRSRGDKPDKWWAPFGRKAGMFRPPVGPTFDI
jgi:hypothetical protein